MDNKLLGGAACRHARLPESRLGSPFVPVLSRGALFHLAPFGIRARGFDSFPRKTMAGGLTGGGHHRPPAKPAGSGSGGVYRG